MGQERPFIVIWELTRACDLACRHCRADAQTQRSPLELDTLQGERLIDQVRELEVPVFVMTGGDPLRRPDLFHLIRYAIDAGVQVSLAPSATPLLTRSVVERLAGLGLHRLGLSLDGSTAERHDTFRGVTGSWALTLEAAGWARACGLALQINSSLTQTTLADLDGLAVLVEALQPVLWSIFFVVPTGRARAQDGLGAEDCEAVFGKLYALSKRVAFGIKTTEAMHYRRFCAQQRARERQAGVTAWPGPDLANRRGINDGKGFAFISHTGEICPSGFLPLSGGNIKNQKLGNIYANSPLFQSLRRTDLLRGKCGACEFREICGGSRARAYALTGDALESDPSCAYVPQAASRRPRMAATTSHPY